MSLISRANIYSICDGSIIKRIANQIYQVMEDLGFTSVLCLAEKMSRKKAARVFKVDSITTILVELASLHEKWIR